MRKPTAIVRYVTYAASAVVALTFLVGAASATSPHYVSGPTGPTISGLGTNTATLSTSFKAAGLGTTVTQVAITLSATSVTGTFVCVNHGQNSPPGQFGPISQVSQTTNLAVKNGQTTGTVTLSVTVPNTCPDHMKIEITSVTFSGVELTWPAQESNLDENFGTVSAP